MTIIINAAYIQHIYTGNKVVLGSRYPWNTVIIKSIFNLAIKYFQLSNKVFSTCQEIRNNIYNII